LRVYFHTIGSKVGLSSFSAGDCFSNKDNSGEPFG
jgi:hypothetical protein